ncbi:MAG: DNA replication and repair protein RecF [Candidatus Shapirobacteria bacterium]|jgi:DNA replication and repair protein RecF
MALTSLTLENFRSYTKSTFEFSPKTNIIIGPNGSGKTNILEAIYFLASGKSFRSSSLSQLVAWNQNYAIVSGNINRSQLEVQLSYPTQGRNLSRKFLIDSISKTRKSYLGNLKVVLFEPEDIRLTTGSPSRRRDFLDLIFLTFEWRYASSLSQYHRALKHRNELLDLIRKGQSSQSELFYWDQSLIKNCQIIHYFRHQFIDSANIFFASHPDPEIQTFYLSYKPNHLSQTILDSCLHQDLAFGHTTAGSHRDDFSLQSKLFSSVSDKNIAFWGSRGQQRLAVLAIRLAQINYLEEIYKSRPLLLLDDIFSELDTNHRQLVVKICSEYQTIITSSDKSSPILLPNSNQINLLQI